MAKLESDKLVYRPMSVGQERLDFQIKKSHQVTWLLLVTITIMYIYHALINALSTHMTIHMCLVSFSVVVHKGHTFGNKWEPWFVSCVRRWVVQTASRGLHQPWTWVLGQPSSGSLKAKRNQMQNIFQLKNSKIMEEKDIPELWRKSQC